MTSPIDTTHLRQLIAGATELPWVYHDPNGVYGGMITNWPGPTEVICEIANTPELDDRPNDFALIVHLANSAEAIADELDQLRREIAELKSRFDLSRCFQEPVAEIKLS